jgi:hypothetical protein
METDRLIHDYIDGNINESQEDQLFSNLAEDSSLRADFKQQLKMTSAVHKDLTAYTPRAASTLNIFDKLGFAGAAVAPVAQKGFFARNSSAIISSVTSAAAAVVLTLLFLEPWGNSVHLDGQMDKFTKNVPMVQSYALNNNAGNIAQAQPEKIVYKYKYVYVNENPQQSGLASTTPEVKYIYAVNNSDAYSNDLLMSRLANEERDYGNSVPNMNLPASSTYDYIAEMPNIKDSRFSVEIGSAGYYVMNGGTMHPEQYQSLNNMNIAAYYKATGDLAIGMDYRRENYYEKFQGKELTNTYAYEQNPNFQVVSLSARYQPKVLQFGMVSPLVEASAGIPVNHLGAGYVVRPMMAGIEIKPFKDFKFMAGVDYSIMYYKQQNNFYNSNKFGIQLRAGWEF